MSDVVEHAVHIVLSNLIGFCHADALCELQHVSRTWRRTYCSMNANQALFSVACLQEWPWLQETLELPHCGHDLWHHYLGNWQFLWKDANRANSTCSLELVVHLDAHKTPGCVHGPWVPFPGRDLQLRIAAYPVGNCPMTTTHLSAYLEVKGPEQTKEWHAALDFNFAMQHRGQAAHEVSGSSGPVRFFEREDGSAKRLDWGCHELLPVDMTRPREVLIKSHVAVQDALVEVVHMDWLKEHVNDFGLCDFRDTFTPRREGCHRMPGRPVRLTLPASTTKAELLRIAAESTGRPVSRIWRFGRSWEARGRLACNLPEAPRHLLSSFSDGDDDDSAVYALLTRWTLGDSSGGAKQHFFRVLAEDRPTTPAVIAAPRLPEMGQTMKVFLKCFRPDGTVGFVASIDVPATEDGITLLIAAFNALREDISGKDWCLVREGTPADWAEELTATMLQKVTRGKLVNGRGPVVDGDILVLCRHGDLSALAALYRSQYSQRVADFVALHALEEAQVGSVSFASLCRVMDRLNVDAWRLERLLNGEDSGRSMLALLASLPGLHPEFFCDACGARELRGVRFNCLECNDFDLCARCYRLQPHSLGLDGRCGQPHGPSHRMVPVWPALPADCLV